MPFEVKKYKNGWYVVKATTGQRYSKKGFKTKAEATKQMNAIGISMASRYK
jgi:hypothetical protein